MTTKVKRDYKFGRKEERKKENSHERKNEITSENMFSNE